MAEPTPTAPTGPLRVCALYPDLMNIYADRGNLLVLERRCAWRGIGFELTASGLGEPLDAGAHDLFYIGGGQDRDQRLCAEDLIENKRDALHDGRRARRADPRRVRRLSAARALLHARRGADRGRRPARRAHRARGRPATDRQRRDRGRARGARAGRRARRARRLRESRRAHPSRARAAAARTRAQRTRQRRRKRLGGRARQATRSAPTCTARCCPRTRGSPTG